MFKNFILKLRQSMQPEYKAQGTTTLKNTSHVISNNVNLPNSMNNSHTDQQQTKVVETKSRGDLALRVDINDSATELNIENAQKNAEEKQLKLDDSIILSDCEIVEVNETISNDKVKSDVTQLDNSIDNISLTLLDKLFENKDLTVKKVKSADSENCTPDHNREFAEMEYYKLDNSNIISLDDLFGKDEVFENVIPDVETKNTELATNSQKIQVEIERLEHSINNNNEITNDSPSSSDADALKGFDSTEIQVIDEHTNKCLKEFDKIFDEVRNEDDIFSPLTNNGDPLDDIVLVENLDLDIDPLSLVNINMCDNDTATDLNNNSREKQLFIDISQLKDNIKRFDENNIVATEDTHKEFQEIDLNNNKITKNTFAYVENPLDKSAEPSKSTQNAFKTNNVSRHDEELNSQSLPNKDDDVISISSDEEIVETTQNIKQITESYYKCKIDITKPDAIKKSAEDLVNHLKTHKTAVEINKIKFFNAKLETICEEKRAHGITSELVQNILTDSIQKWKETNVKKCQEQMKNFVQKPVNSTKNIKNDLNNDSNTNIQEHDNKKSENVTSNATEHKIDNENLDTISVSSEEMEEITKAYESDDCGYNSSDFEFISEEEAKKGGLINNNSDQKAKNTLNRDVTKNKKLDHHFSYRNEMHDPLGPGPSHRCSCEESEEKERIRRENYKVPEENETINIFQSLPPIPLSEIHHLENKSIRSRVPMLVQYDGVGFHMSLALHRDSRSEEPHQEEANESMKKILDMYPGENVRTRRGRKRKRML